MTDQDRAGTSPCRGADPTAPVDLIEDRTATESSELHELYERLGIPGIIDLHTHFMPDRVMSKVWHYFDVIVPRFGVDWPITYRGSERERIDWLAELGVIAFTSLVYPHKPEMAEWLNDWSLGFSRRTPGCIPTATFYPEPDALRYVTEAIDRGASVFKSHIQVGDYDPNDPLLDPVWAMLADRRVPVVIHSGSGPAPGRFTGPDRVGSLLDRYPELHLVIAHMGLPEYSRFMDLAERYEHVWLDTTMVFTDFTEKDHPFPRDEVGRLVDLGDRIVFGSDYPNIPYPYVAAVRAITDMGLGDDWVRGVLHDNAARLGVVPSR